MGLDNGIVIKRTPETKRIKELQRFEYMDFEDGEEEITPYYDICYWRKCWNIRSMILGCVKNKESVHGKWQLNIEDIENIIKGLKSFNKHNWDEYGGSIWAFHEIKRRLRQNIRDLKLVKKIIIKHDLKVEFYDSY